MSDSKEHVKTTLINLAKNYYDETGSKITSVDFEWFDRPGETSELIDLKVEAEL